MFKGGGGCTLIFPYICRVIFWVQNFYISIFLGGFRKNGGGGGTPLSEVVC